jgi:hypothetical protein
MALVAMNAMARPACAELVLLSPSLTWTDASLEADDEGRRSSTHARTVPLRKLLEEIARRSGVTIRGHEALDRSVAVPPSALSAGTSLRKLLARVNHVLVVEPSPDGDLKPVLVLIVAQGESHPHGGDAAMARTLRHPDLRGSPYQPDLSVETLLDDPDPAIRRWAVEQLGEHGGEPGLARLVQALDDEDPGVREAALAGLGQYGDVAVEALKSRLKHERIAQVRVAALELLGRLGGANVVELLAETLDERDVEVRVAAIEALARINQPAARGALLAAARDREPVIRMAALDALALHASEDVAEAAVEEGLGDEEDTVRDLASSLTEVVRHRWLSPSTRDRGR